MRAGITGSGDVDPANPTTCTIDAYGYIGINTYATVKVNAGSDLLSQHVSLACNSRSTGEVTVDGPGSTWTNSGGITEIIDSTGDGTWNALDYPRGIAVDDSGNAYVTGDYSDNAFKITPDGSITEIIDSTEDVDFQGFAAFASEWLQVDCSEPDWCGRADRLLRRRWFFRSADSNRKLA